MNRLEKYIRIRDSLNTGDLVFFSGKGHISSIIKNFTNSKYSHVGMVLKLDLPLLSQEKTFIIESTTLNNQKDIILDEYRKGVQIIPLAQRIEAYDGSVSIYKLNQPLTVDEERILVGWCLQLHTSKVDYDDLIELIKAGIDVENMPWYKRILFTPFKRVFLSKQNLKKLFCSELVCKALQQVYRVPLTINPSEQVPEDLLKIIDLGPEIPLA